VVTRSNLKIVAHSYFRNSPSREGARSHLSWLAGEKLASSAAVLAATREPKLMACTPERVAESEPRDDRELTADLHALGPAEATAVSAWALSGCRQRSRSTRRPMPKRRIMQATASSADLDPRGRPDAGRHQSQPQRTPSAATSARRCSRRTLGSNSRTRQAPLPRARHVTPRHRLENLSQIRYCCHPHPVLSQRRPPCVPFMPSRRSNHRPMPASRQSRVLLDDHLGDRRRRIRIG
jgi:hypothetical protein